MGEEGKVLESIVNKIVSRKWEKILLEKYSKYGIFIIQTNEIQGLLVAIILQNVIVQNIKFIGVVEKETLGALIKRFEELLMPTKNLMITKLKLYNKDRIALAHKMYTVDALLEEDCKKAIQLGEMLVDDLRKLIKK